MPHTRIEIEQVEGNRWVAELEAGGRPGGPPFKRQTINATSFAAMMGAVVAAYFAQVPDAEPLNPPQVRPAPEARPEPISAPPPAAVAQATPQPQPQLRHPPQPQPRTYERR